MSAATTTIVSKPKKKKSVAVQKSGRYFEAVGRRKTSIARVRVFPSAKNELVVNDRTFGTYFPILDLRQIVMAPLEVLDPKLKFKISVKVSGGGLTSQAGAISHGLARALTVADVANRPLLKKNKFLRRDPRMKERRKFGLKKARKAPQWSKR